MLSIGDGRATYTSSTMREYLRRVRRDVEFYRIVLERLARLESRYQKNLDRKYNENSPRNQ